MRCASSYVQHNFLDRLKGAFAPFLLRFFAYFCTLLSMSFKVVRSTSGVKFPCPEGAVIAIGNFDGIHKGHRAMIRHSIALAHQKDLVSVVMTFDPHPKEILRPEQKHEKLMKIADKASVLRRLGVDMLYVQRFTRKFAELTARDFFDKILVTHLNVKHIVVGADFVFGANREGTLALLKEWASEKNIDITVFDDILEKGERVSSTAIRHALKKGCVETAEKMLEQPWQIRLVLKEDDYLVLRGDLSQYLSIKNAVYWVRLKYVYGAYMRKEKLPVSVVNGEMKIHPIGQIPDIPEGRVWVSFLRKEKDIHV